MPSALIVTFAQSTVLNAISNLLAQLIDQRKNTTPFTLNTLALLQFVTYGILIVPINFYWQRALEARYPGFPSRAEIGNLLRSWRSLFSFSALRAFFSSAISSEGSPRMSDDGTALPLHREKEKEKETTGRWAPRAQRSGLHSFVMKFLFDQTVAGAMNIVLFVVLINFLKGENLSKVWELVLVDFRPIMIARLKYRPVVSTLMYTVIPVDRRVVFGSACGVIWGIYLSLYAVV
ncbi:putative peroxisomal membrane protein 2, pxmp2 [Penicillium brasilianum]|uniref:Putative peroxisomal membrane protein 2, pxmp2 n=1 Tax=Penicillium brasilianum TaxID=104259 RepID=A0A1S9RBG6_PENBI|nr:putative peroxisomal membrane protein 2, pxmp2 [Penicillium brasilianum]